MFQFRQITLNLIYFLNVLLIFLLLFENKVQLPILLQVTGRMHPLVLHFPLALFFVGIFLEWIIRKKSFQHPATIRITAYVFYLFALSAAFTALFGFFLFKEGSYLGEKVILHKWTGTALSLLAVLIVSLKAKPVASYYYYGILAITAICLVCAGHFGAEVTHGEGFLTEPLQQQQEIAQIENPDSAIVFRDVIQPILNEKCLNCHNPNRAKNDLILSDYQSIMKGGETDEAVIPGKADESLLYKYIVLPVHDSLHMPPKEKMQLDRQEIKLIAWWINTGAVAHQKYASLPKVDSIETIMREKFRPKKGLDLLEIAFADQEEIKSLNNPYRTVQQISATKPYIAVFLGSKKDFSKKDLTELGDIGNQVVSIDLGNSQVKDDDLKAIKEFPHVQKLHLQNISVGDEGVKYLKDLRHLETLNLSGTKISVNALKEISGWQPLKKLYIYNTKIPKASVESLKKSRPELEIYNTQFDLSDTIYDAKLTAPVVKIDSSFFRQRALVEVKLSRGKVKYYYTLDGTKPSPKSNLYTEPFQVNQSGELKMMATMEGWTDSEAATFPMVKLGIRPNHITLETKPHPKYAAKLDSTLVDGKAGSVNRDDKEYLGFFNRDAEVLFQINSKSNVSQLTISFLEDVAQGVFAPKYVEVWGGDDKNNLTKLAKVECVQPQKARPASKNIIKVNFPPQPVRYLRLKVKNIMALPTWLELPKNTKASVFIDEVALE